MLVIIALENNDVLVSKLYVCPSALYNDNYYPVFVINKNKKQVSARKKSIISAIFSQAVAVKALFRTGAPCISHCCMRIVNCALQQMAILWLLPVLPFQF